MLGDPIFCWNFMIQWSKVGLVCRLWWLLLGQWICGEFNSGPVLSHSKSENAMSEKVLVSGKTQMLYVRSQCSRHHKLPSESRSPRSR